MSGCSFFVKRRHVLGTRSSTKFRNQPLRLICQSLYGN
jgi:hypothetical protein